MFSNMPAPSQLLTGHGGCLRTLADSSPQCLRLLRVCDNTECFSNNSPLPLFPYSNPGCRSTALAKTSLSNRTILLLLTTTLKVT